MNKTGVVMVVPYYILILTIISSFFTSSLEARSASDVELFRNIFHKYASKEYPKKEIRKMILFPSSTMTRSLEESNAYESFLEKERLLSEEKPSDLYLNSLVDDFEKIKSPLNHREPITIIILPGVLGEFIDSSPFEEILRSNSSLKRKVNRLFKNEKESVYFLSKMKPQKIKFNKLVVTGSIDDVLGRPMVKLIYLKPLFASLESLGRLNENNKIYEKRLEKLFSKIAKPKNLYLLGYSQGASVALELVKHISKTPKPAWATNLKGLISLAGVLHGSAIAQKASVVGSQSYDLVASARKLLNLKESTAINDIKDNMDIWKTFIFETKDLLSDVSLSSQDKNINLSVYWTIKTAAKAIHNLGLNNPLFAYKDNIKRFKILIKQGLHSLHVLNYESRMNWWRENTIPTDISYFSINGVMGDKRYDSKKTDNMWTRYRVTVICTKRSFDGF